MKSIGFLESEYLFYPETTNRCTKWIRRKVGHGCGEERGHGSRVLPCAHFTEELWKEVTFVFVRKAGRTAVRRIHFAPSWWFDTNDWTAEARRGWLILFLLFIFCVRQTDRREVCEDNKEDSGLYFRISQTFFFFSVRSESRFHEGELNRMRGELVKKNM